MPLSYTDEDVANDAAKPRLADRKFLLQVTAASKSVNEKGNLKVTARVRPIHPATGDVVGASANLYLTLPVKTPKEDLDEARLPDDVQKEIPNTIFFITSYYEARQNPKNADAYPVHPVQKVGKIGGKYVEVAFRDGPPTGNPAKSKAEGDEDRKALARQVRAFMSDLYDTKGEIIVGDRFYGDCEYDPAFDMVKVEVSPDQSASGAWDGTGKPNA